MKKQLDSLVYTLALVLTGLVFAAPLTVWVPEVFGADNRQPETEVSPHYSPFSNAAIGPGPTAPAPQQAAAPLTLAPPLDTMIEGINFDENGSNNGGVMRIPPDPIGATGPGHLVSVVNTSIEWHTKAGFQQNSQGLGSFFATLSPAGQIFDPKVIFDQHAGRFLVVVLEIQATMLGDPANTSRILVAASDDSDPNGTWFFHAIDSKLNIFGLDHWADYPGLAIDEEAVYITSNMFTFQSTPFFGGSRLWIIDKGESTGGFYVGGTATVNVHDPEGATGVFSSITMPAHVFGEAGVPGAGNPGTFLVRYSGLSDGVDEFLSIIRINDPLGAAGGPSFTHQFVPAGDIDDTFSAMPDAPQAGTGTLIATNDRRALHAVWRDNALWATAQVVPGFGPDAGQATAHWWEINTTSLDALSLVQQGDVGGEDIAAGTYTFFPSIAVDGNGNMGIGFAASAPSIFPGAYYTGRGDSDAPGTVQPAETLAAGLDFYIRTLGTGNNRWGDYSGIAVDPSDDATFWVFNEYALNRGLLMDGEDGRWGTRWGSFSLVAACPLNDTTAFVKQLYRDFLNREGDPSGIEYWVEQIDSGAITRAQAVESFLLSQEFGERIAPIVRLYFAYFLRIPDFDGLMFWVNANAEGASLEEISGAFASSPEFQTQYGGLDNEEFVILVYQNVLEREPDAGGLAYWTAQLDSGSLTRGQLMLGFSESEEYRGKSWNKVLVTMVYVGLLRRTPDQGGFDYWVGILDAGASSLELIDSFLNSEEYANRFTCI